MTKCCFVPRFKQRLQTRFFFTTIALGLFFFLPFFVAFVELVMEVLMMTMRCHSGIQHQERAPCLVAPALSTVKNETCYSPVQKSVSDPASVCALLRKKYVLTFTLDTSCIHMKNVGAGWLAPLCTTQHSAQHKIYLLLFLLRFRLCVTSRILVTNQAEQIESPPSLTVFLCVCVENEISS